MAELTQCDKCKKTVVGHLPAYPIYVPPPEELRDWRRALDRTLCPPCQGALLAWIDGKEPTKWDQ